MPYFITDSADGCSGWATIKADGEIVGCHQTKAAAIKQMVAISLAEKIEPGGERALNNQLEVGDFVFWENAGQTEYGLITLVSTYGVVVDQIGGTFVATQDMPLAKISVYELVIDRLVGTERFVVKPFAPLHKLQMPERQEEQLDEESGLPDNYRPALAPDVPEGRACGNCFFFNENNLNEDGTKAWCERWDEFVDGGYYCNAWQSNEEERAIDVKVPAYMRAAARRGLEYVSEGKAGDGLKQQTINEARKMAAGEISDDKWIRMSAWIARHLGDLDSPEADPQNPNYPSAGVVAHLLWGSGPSKTKARAAMDFAQGVVERIRKEEDRHLPGKHNQKSHAGGRISGQLARSVLEKVRANGGLSVNMLSGNEPAAGYMVAKGADLGGIVSADDFYDETKIQGIISDYFKKNKSELSGSDNYLGIWHNTEDGQVYLDVSQNILDRTEAIVAGQIRDQISIWDVVNFEEIGTGGTGDIRTNRHSKNPGHFGNDGSRDRSTFSGTSQKDLDSKRQAAERIIRHLPGKHNQKNHAPGKSIFRQGSNSPQKIKELHDRIDPSQKSVYKAEQIVDQTNFDLLSKPVSPKLKDFDSPAEYSDAYDKYSKEHNKWALEQLTDINSDLGKQHLDGTKKGVENYVNDVTDSDWFIEKFGTSHPELGKPKVALSNAKSYSGQVSLTKKNGNYNYQLKLNRDFAKHENTILHEIAHHAVNISAKDKYEGHGINFRNAHIFIAENVIGKEYADTLTNAYKAEGLN
jgi:hypothetical protein